MNTTVNLNLDPVAFYQQKMLLVELTDKFFDTYHNGDTAGISTCILYRRNDYG